MKEKQKRDGSFYDHHWKQLSGNDTLIWGQFQC